MTVRQAHAGWLSLAATARSLGQKGLARTCLREARSARYCPYHGAYDALLPLPN